MFYGNRVITVSSETATINKPVILYRGDYNVEVKFQIIEIPYTQKVNTTDLLAGSDASFGQLLIRIVDGAPIFSEITEIDNNSITFTFTADMLDEVEEVGDYDLQIRLFDEDRTSRVTLPPISGALKVKEGFAVGDDSTSNLADEAITNYAIATYAESEDVFNSDGSYNATTWSGGQIISSAKLNKIEQGISGVNEKISNSEVDLSLTRHTDGKVYIMKQDGTLMGDGIEIGKNDVDLSKITMHMSGQTLILSNDGTQIATVEIPTAVVTDEQLTNIIQAKIDDGTLSSMTIEDNSVTPKKTTFLKEKQGLLDITFSGYAYLKVISDYIDISEIDYLYFATKPQSNKYFNYGIITYDTGQQVITSETSLDNTISKIFNSNEEEVLYGCINCIQLRANNVTYVRLTQHENIVDGSSRVVADSPIDIETFEAKTNTIISDTIISGIKDSIDLDIEDTNFVSYTGSLVDFSKYENSGYSGTLFDQAGANQNVFYDYIDTSVNKDIYLRLFMETSSSVSQYVSALTYDGDKNFIAKLDSTNWTFVRGDNCTITNPDYSVIETGNINGVSYRHRSVQKITVGEDVKYVKISIAGAYSGLLSSVNKASQYAVASYNDIFDFDSIPEKYGMKVNDDFKNVVNKCVEKDSKTYSMVMIGDSLTNWAGGSNTQDGFLKVVYDKTGVISTNRGLAGAWWQTGDGQDQCGVNRVNYIVQNKEKYDVYAFMLGTNQGTATDTGETSSDTSTMPGAIRYCMETLKAYDPTGQILVCLPPQRAEGNANQKAVNDLIKTIVEDEYSVRTLDIYRHSGIVPNTTIADINYLTDGLHLNTNGFTVLGNLLASEIKYLLCL